MEPAGVQLREIISGAQPGIKCHPGAEHQKERMKEVKKSTGKAKIPNRLVSPKKN